MKTRKTIPYRDLIMEVTTQIIHFKAQPPDIKAQIEVLMSPENGYMKRMDNDKNMLEYLP